MVIEKLKDLDESRRNGPAHVGYERVGAPPGKLLTALGKRLVVVFLVFVVFGVAASSGHSAVDRFYAVVFLGGAFLCAFLMWRWRKSLRPGGTSLLARELHAACLEIPALVEVSRKDGNEIRSLAVTVWVSEDEDEVVLYLMKRPGRHLAELSKLKEQFEAALCLPCSSVEDEIGEVVYRFPKHARKPDRIVEEGAFVLPERVTPYNVPLDGDPSHDWRLGRNPHMLLTGLTGSGKSILASYIALALANSKLDDRLPGCEFYVIDPKEDSLASLRDAGLGESRVAVTPNQAARLLRELVEEMRRRYSEYGGRFGTDWRDWRDADGKAVSTILLIVDETPALMAMAKTSGGKALADEIGGYIQELAYKARACGIQLLVMAQRPDANNLPGGAAVRDQLGARVLCGSRPSSRDQAAMAFPGADLDEVMSTTLEGVGVGWVMYSDGEKPFAVEFPYLDGIDFIAEFERAYLRTHPECLEVVADSPGEVDQVD